MSCYIEDKVDYEIFELTEENCNKTTDELNDIFTSSSQDPRSSIASNKNGTLQKAKSALQVSKSCNNATAIAKEHELITYTKKVDVKNNEDKKGYIKKYSSVPSYQRQSRFSVASRIIATPYFKSKQQHHDARYASRSKQSIYTDISAQEELLAKQRREAAESLRRRRLANRQQEGGMKRKNMDEPANEAKRLHTDATNNNQKRDHSSFNEPKRLATQSNHASPRVSSHSFLIRGAAAKASQHGRTKEEERKPKAELQDRLSNVRKKEETKLKAPHKPPITARLQRREQASPMSKKVENGKSSELVISNFNENTTFNDIKKLVDESNAVAKITYRNGEPTSTLLFGSIDTAVVFRRKYNRSKVSDSHIAIAFKK